MGSIERAILYFRRKKGKSFLAFLVLFFLCLSVLASISIKRTVDKEIDALQQSLGSSFLLKADTENMGYYETRSGNGFIYQAYIGPYVTDDMIEKICQIEGVEDYEINTHSLIWTELKLRPGLWADSEGQPEDEYLTADYIKMSKQTTRALNCREGDFHPYFRNGAFEITQGRNIQENDCYKAVISENLAERNGLNLHDTFRIEIKAGMMGPTEDEFATVGEPIELEIVGMFRVNFEQEATIYTSEDHLAENLIVTDLNTRIQLRRNQGIEDGNERHSEVTFFVDSPEILPSVMTEIKETIDINGLLLEMDDTTYASSVEPYEQISILMTMFLVAEIAGCALILCLLYIHWVRSRKKEIGILMSIGIGRRKIWGQFVLEGFISAATAFLLACLLAGPVTQGVGNLAENLTVPQDGSEAYQAEKLPTESLIVISKVSSERIELRVRQNATDILVTGISVCGIVIGSISVGFLKLKSNDLKKLLDSM